MESITRYMEDEIREALNSLKLGSKAERNIRIVTEYLGYDGEGGRKGGKSMQSIADPLGLTREMVRQITSKATKLCRAYDGKMRKLEEAATIITEILPCSAADAEQALLDAGIVRKHFRVEGVINALDAFGIKHNVHSIVEHKGGRFLINTDKQEKWASSTLSKAGSMVSHNGACSVATLAKILTSIRGTKVKTESASRFVRGVIESRPEQDVVWLDDECNWFTFSQVARNRVIRRVEKIFSIAVRAHITDIRRGIHRSFLKNTKDDFQMLPEDILIALMESTGNFKSTGKGMVEPTREFDPNEYLKEYEILIVNEIRASAYGIGREGEMERNIIYRNNATEDQAKTHKFGFSVALNFSPVILKVENERGQYKLTGRLK